MNFKDIITYSLVLLGLTLSSCGMMNSYTSPEVSYESLYRNVENTDTHSIAQIKWNQVFTDPILQKLIEKGIEENLDLKMAYLRIQQSRAYFQQSRAALFPSLNANANVNFAHLPENQAIGNNRDVTQFQLGVSSAWEVDIWGKLASSRRAALANLLQTEAAKNAIQTQLIANIAQYYYLLLALDQQLEITILTVDNWEHTVETMEALKEAAKVTGAAVVQSEAQKYAAEVTIPDLKQSIREVENALSILLAEEPKDILRGNLVNQQIINELNAGVPAQLLSYRPDVRQAEYAYRQTFEMTNMARTYFYPALTISAAAGFNSFDLEELINPVSLAANVAGGLMQPILNNRQNKTRLEVAKAQQEEAMLNFKKTLLIAGQEVSNALSKYEAARQKVAVRKKQVEALEKSVEYSQELLENGFAVYTEVITARQSLLQAELGRVNDRLEQLQATVDLYQSLGGGWSHE